MRTLLLMAALSLAGAGAAYRMRYADKPGPLTQPLWLRPECEEDNPLIVRATQNGCCQGRLCLSGMRRGPWSAIDRWRTRQVKS